MPAEKLLSQLVARLESAFSRDLRSVVLYGSAVAGDFQERRSDLNVLCVLRELRVDHLEKFEQTGNWWRAQGNPAPLLMAEGELSRASDAFPMEFFDIREQHRVLHGEELVAAIGIDPVFHRVQVEHELRSKLLALRQRYAGIYRDHKAVVELLAEALPSVATVMRHALIISGEHFGGPSGERPPAQKRAIIEAAAAGFGIDPAPYLAVLEVREGKRKARDLDARSVFEGYYAGLIRVCDGVDSLEKKANIL